MAEIITLIQALNTHTKMLSAEYSEHLSRVQTTDICELVNEDITRIFDMQEILDQMARTPAYNLGDIRIKLNELLSWIDASIPDDGLTAWDILEPLDNGEGKLALTMFKSLRPSIEAEPFFSGIGASPSFSLLLESIEADLMRLTGGAV